MININKYSRKILIFLLKIFIMLTPPQSPSRECPGAPVKRLPVSPKDREYVNLDYHMYCFRNRYKPSIMSDALDSCVQNIDSATQIQLDNYITNLWKVFHYHYSAEEFCYLLCALLFKRYGVAADTLLHMHMNETYFEEVVGVA
jgi:hypothetical protein